MKERWKPNKRCGKLFNKCWGPGVCLESDRECGGPCLSGPRHLGDYVSLSWARAASAISLTTTSGRIAAVSMVRV